MGDKSPKDKEKKKKKTDKKATNTPSSSIMDTVKRPK